MVAPTPRGVDVTEPVSTAALYKRAGLLRDTTAEPVTKGEPVTKAGPAPVQLGYVPAGKPHLSSLSQHVEPYCGGTGTDGRRIQVIYARATGTTDRFSQVEALLRNEIANVDDVFAVSSAETGGGKRVRWVTDASCVPTIVRVELPSSSLTSNLYDTIAALQARGYDSPSRKYLVFADASRLCGVGNMYPDESPIGNDNDGYAALFARVDTQCWSTPTDDVSTPAHEVMHTLGSIMDGSPNSNRAGHCSDDGDLMCYADGSGVPLRQVCPASHEPLFDCNSNDYFSTNPPAGSYLATHWNTANSSFLANAVPLALTPTATISGPTTAKTGQTITLSVSALGATGYEWSGPSIISSTTGAIIKATPTNAGTLTYAVTARFANNVAVQASRVVTVALAPVPTVTISAPSSVESGKQFTATGSATVTGAATYRWTVGQGCLPSGSTGQASVSATCSSEVVGQTVPMEVTVTQTDGQSKKAVKQVGVTPPVAVERWAGGDRFASSAAFSAKSFAPGVGVAYVANGMNFPDALSGAPIAGKNGGPVLLTNATSLPGAIAAELKRLQPKKIVVLGGTGAVSNTVKAKLDAYTAGAVDRWAGSRPVRLQRHLLRQVVRRRRGRRLRGQRDELPRRPLRGADRREERRPGAADQRHRAARAPSRPS